MELSITRYSDDHVVVHAPFNDLEQCNQLLALLAYAIQNAPTQPNVNRVELSGAALPVAAVMKLKTQGQTLTFGGKTLATRL